MAYKIPNYSDATYSDQAEPDSVDFDILSSGFMSSGVVSGCAVTAQATPNMTVNVGAGSLYVGGRFLALTAGNVTAASANATNPRFDLVTIGIDGTKYDTTGTPASNPVFPAIPANRTVLASLYIPAASTAIGATQITDKRVMLNPSVGWYNVKSYGALGNGSTDDAPAMQAALDACRLAGGGTVYFPPGTYMIGSQQGNQQYVSIPKPGLSIGSKTTVQGSGPGNTIIKLTGGQDHGYEMIMNWDNDTLVNTDIIVRDIEIDGTRGTPPVDHAAYGAAIVIRKGMQCKYINVYAHDTYVRGLVFEAGYYNRMMYCHSDNNEQYAYILSNENYSFYISCSGSENISNDHGTYEFAYNNAYCGMIGCTSYVSGYSGRHVHIKGSTTVDSTLVSSSIFWGGHQGVLAAGSQGAQIVNNLFIAIAGWCVTTDQADSMGSQVSNNMATRCWLGLMYNPGSNWNISNNTGQDCVVSAFPGTPFIELIGTSATYNHVQGNLIRGGAIGGYGDGIAEVFSGINPDYNIIENNDVSGLQSGYVPITLLGTNSVKRHNRGSTDYITRSKYVAAYDTKAISGAADNSIGAVPNQIYCKLFSPTVSDQLIYNLTIPTTYSTSANAYLDWIPPDAGTGSAVWELYYASLGTGANTTAAGIGLTAISSACGTAFALQRATLGTGLSVTAGQLYKMSIRRLGAATADTYSSSANFSGFELKWSEAQ
jgi:hypothetical protein